MKTSCAFLMFAAVSFAAVAANPQGGVVVGWGGNVSGEATGVATYPEKFFSTGTVAVAGQTLSNVVAIAAGRSHCLALKENGTVVNWGGSLIGGVSSVKPGTVQISGAFLTNVIALSAGGNFSLALLKSGNVAAWGDGLGERHTTELLALPPLSNIVSVAAGWNYGMALDISGSVISWGARTTPGGLSNVVAIAAGGETFAPALALKGDGTVMQWTSGGAEPVPLEATNIISIAAGESHCLALRKDGTVVGWGSNRFGEATGVPTTGFPSLSSGQVKIEDQTLQNVVAIAAGREFSMALKRDGRLVMWGQNGFHQCDVPAGLTNIAAIAAGDHVSLALITNSAGWRPSR